MANTFKFGNGKWAVKEGSALAYNDENGNFKPLPFDFTRATSATRVNKDGLIEVVGSNEPRIDFKDDANGALLLEPSRSNLYNYSEPTTNEGTMGGITYESFNWAIGFTNCIKYGDNSVARYRYGGTVSASTEYTLSAFVIMDDLSEPIIGGQTSGNDFTFVIGGVVFNNANASVNMGNNIYRVSVTATTSASPNTANNGIIKYTTQSNKGFRVVGYQLEQGSYATSYIPTQGSAVTRVAEVANGAGNDQVINSTEGVFYVEMKSDFNDNATKRISISDFTNNNRLTLYFNISTNLIGTVIVTALGGSPSSLSYVIPSFSTYNKIALKYKTNDYALWINGVEVDTELIGNTFSQNVLKTIRFEQGAGGLHYFYGNTKDVRVYNTALTDAELQALTT
jgi:hypothetical protein